MQSPNELLKILLDSVTDNIYVQNPCKVVNVSEDGNKVDVLLYINDEEVDTVIYNVPIVRPETQRAYIYLGVKEGDRGVCRFFDRSVESYLQSDFEYNSDERQHDINDRCFELGFLPNNEVYQFLDKNAEIEIGLKNQSFKLSIDNEGNLNIASNGVLNLTANTINSSGVINHTGDINITGTLTATTIIAENGTSGTFTQSVTSENGIVTGGA